MLLKDGRYYFMWSEGGWTGPDYAVAYAVADSPTGPFRRIGKILEQDPAVATGAGHHSVLHAPGSDRWYIVYHRRPLGETDRNHRVVCIDELRLTPDGRIEPVKITMEGVARGPLN
jgi:beta-xylosidase